ncbi:galactose oxidase [Trametes polyzona]|nr:galactose oxidase [Trametes polyzona]
MVKGQWTLLSKAASLARSSHCTSVTKSGLLIVYGGEYKPRTPVDTGAGHDAVPKGSLHVFDLSKSALVQQWSLLSPASSLEGENKVESVPEPRVGATTVWHDGSLYMWGGRGGQEMTPFDARQIGVWKATVDDPGQGVQGTGGSNLRWERLVATNEDQAPSPRSYHTAVAHAGKLYIHAGCPDTGRLSTLHAFDISERLWKILAPAPEPGRGGTCLVAVTLAASQEVLLRYGGFSGFELPTAAGTIDVYSVAEDKWSTVEPSPDPSHGFPGPRSVHGFTSFRSKAPSLSSAVALLYQGERDASSLGHAGAGTFWDDAWVLSKEAGDDLLSGWQWHKVDVGQTNIPEGRGWFSPASWVDPEGDTRVLMFGGLLSSNTRSDELWELRVD